MSKSRFATPHKHVFLGAGHRDNERRTWVVIVLTALMMVVEIAAGTAYGSMALVADGWHMATHAAALTITALAYVFARRNADNPNFTFGTGKFGDLAGFASAVLLALIALQIGIESAVRLYSPIAIDFNQAIAVAVIGLAVNLVSAWLLGGHSHDHAGHGHDDHGHHDDDHDHDHPGHSDDNNLRAAYLHVIADALTSVLAIAALALGRIYGWIWLDPLIGIVGSLIIARWSWGLIRDSGARLLDYLPPSDPLPGKIRRAIEADGDRIGDLHIWRLGPSHIGAIVAVSADQPKDVGHYRDQLAHIEELSHLTVEVEKAGGGLSRRAVAATDIAPDGVRTA